MTVSKYNFDIYYKYLFNFKSQLKKYYIFYGLEWLFQPFNAMDESL